jgi:hypothetical protein
MRPERIVEILIETNGPVCVRSLIEASAHLPRRGTRWVAAYRDENGRPVWRGTGARDKKTAMAKAIHWEQEARRKREAKAALPRKPSIRVRPGSAERELGLLSQREVATALRISTRAVREIERKAFDKIRRHPALRDLWREWLTGEVEETVTQDPSQWRLSRAEIAAVYALAKTPAEQQVLRKVLALTQGGSAVGV